MESFKWLSLFTLIGMLHGPTTAVAEDLPREADRKSTRLNSSHVSESRMPSSA